MNNLEEKKKFFALYFGKDILIHRIGFQNRPNVNIEYIDNHDMLILKSLDDITDNDAEYVIGKKECNLRKEDKNGQYYGLSPSEIFKNQLNISFYSTDADYLRSKGYAIGYLKYSVEDLIKFKWIKNV